MYHDGEWKGAKSGDINIECLDNEETCCWKVHATFTNGHKNDFFTHHSAAIGDYEMNPGFVNGKVHYTSTFDNGKYGIWFSDLGSWMVGNSTKRGQDIGFLFNRTPDKCPHHMVYDWKYFIPEYKTWANANEGFSIWCKS